MLNHLTSRWVTLSATTVIALIVGCGICASPALAAAGEGCPNEQIRSESNTNPATGQPYSVGLPECRAYEMVSPLYKQAHDAILAAGEPVAPDGEAVDFASLGGFSGFEDLEPGSGNPYLSQRSDASWLTQAQFPPPSLIVTPRSATDGGVDYSNDLSKEVVCGQPGTGDELREAAVVCALRQSDGQWTATPAYPDLAPAGDGITTTIFLGGIGSSGDLSNVVFQVPSSTSTTVHFLPTDTDTYGGNEGGSIYEIVGVGTSTPVLRLVNVDDAGDVIGPENPTHLGASGGEAELGSDYHAISEDGSMIFFTATPQGGVQTVYARIELPGEQYETISLSNPSPSQCSSCSAEAQPATFQGASANGMKVFFTTTQQLTNADTDTSSDLYEYDFEKPEGERIVQVSGGGSGDPSPGTGAEVQGVASVSSDGSHVYFVARGLLTTTPNGSGQAAQSGADNMYVFDTVTDETKFVAKLCSGPDASGERSDADCGANLNSIANFAEGEAVNDVALWDSEARSTGSYPEQGTPDGQYLVFTTYAQLSPSDTDTAQDVYRYDFQSGELTLVSHGASDDPSAGNKDGMSATIADQFYNVAVFGDHADVGDLNRQISENGEYVIFSTAESLQADDTNTGANPGCNRAGTTGCDVYEWHDGTVSLISDGQDPAGADVSGSEQVGASDPSMSATGSDVFFTTETKLVGQDTDELADVYDARIDGGFPAPAPAPSCSGEACQGGAASSPAFGTPGSQSFTGGGNLTTGSTSFPPPVQETKPKPLTRAQKLTKALKSCKKDHLRSKRATCEKAAKKKYVVNTNAKGKKHAGGKKHG